MLGMCCNTSQVLSGKEHNMRLFGYSLAGNMDLDGNMYPDVAVGSLSDTAVIYRWLSYHPLSHSQINYKPGGVFFYTLIPLSFPQSAAGH